MKLDFSVLDAPVRAADKLEAEWCVPVAPRAPDRFFFAARSTDRVRSGTESVGAHPLARTRRRG